ncbi:hypothetical protein [Anaerorhabdus furcosa]|uniref:Uncharacterized protein n=1 Tax=Anaerorhabdus furcosa TaxID=118967 RepID=A0A1T4M344_9FIRM|nr:hypothetical protein [Anaerorhabdus furcosa]SJZ61307.1 hypothetical protein SAMN02745191_1163 [Anaerorhabdus furcosa]
MNEAKIAIYLSILALIVSIIDIMLRVYYEKKWKNREVLDKLLFELTIEKLPNLQYNLMTLKTEDSINDYLLVLDTILSKLSVVRLFDLVTYSDLFDTISKIEENLESFQNSPNDIEKTIFIECFSKNSKKLILDIINLKMNIY